MVTIEFHRGKLGEKATPLFTLSGTPEEITQARALRYDTALYYISDCYPRDIRLGWEGDTLCATVHSDLTYREGAYWLAHNLATDLRRIAVGIMQTIHIENGLHVTVCNGRVCSSCGPNRHRSAQLNETCWFSCSSVVFKCGIHFYSLRGGKLEHLRRSEIAYIISSKYELVPLQ